MFGIFIVGICRWNIHMLCIPNTKQTNDEFNKTNKNDVSFSFFTKCIDLAALCIVPYSTKQSLVPI